MKNKKYHTVGTFPKYNRKTKNTTLSEHFQNTTEKQKIPHCRNISKIQQKNHRKRQNTLHTNTGPITFLAWYRHLKVAGLSLFYEPKIYKHYKF